MRIVIIGNSAAGTAAIEAIRQHDRDSSIVQLSDESFPLYSRCLLPYYVAGSLHQEMLGYRQPDFHETMGVKLYAGPEFYVSKLDTAKQRVECSNGTTVGYDRLLLSTGSSAKLPPNLPRGVQGIHVLRNFADAENIREQSPTVTKAVVLGAGLIGIKAATALNEGGMKTTLVARSERVLSQMIDSEASRIITQQLHEKKIEVLLGTDISEVQAVGNRLVGVKTDNGHNLECQMLIAAKGVSPNTSLIDPSVIEKRTGIRTDPHMRTSQENIFAAGDVAEAFDIALNEYTVNALWTCAAEQGRIAGLNIAGKTTSYNGAVGMNSLNVCDVSLISYGLAAPDDESKYRIIKSSRPTKNIYRKFVIGSDHRIKGIILMGKIENAGVFLSLIQQKIDVSPFQEELLSDRFHFGKLLKYSGEAGILAADFRGFTRETA